MNKKILSKTNRLKGFYKLNRGERLDALRDFNAFPVDQLRILGQDGALPFELADLFVENAIGSFPLPFGIATNFRVNGCDYAVPMAVEESSVIAAASNAAKMVFESGGFESSVQSSLMIGQIQVLDIERHALAAASENILSQKKFLLQRANECHPRLLMRGGGARDLEVRTFPNVEIPFLVVHILMDTRDAMGANLINTVCERLAPDIETISSGRAGLKILSNLADRKVFRSRCCIRPELLVAKDPSVPLTGLQIGKRIFEASLFAECDSYRATTHNKGIMNGIDPVVIATGNDWRAIEAGAHAFAARSGLYKGLSHWRLEEAGLVGEIEIPLQLGTVGGVTRLHPLAQLSLQILRSPSAELLGQIIASVGLASNLSALRALVTTGIQHGHMRLHAKNLALAAGARGREIEVVAQQLVQEKRVTATAAEQVVAQIRANNERNDSAAPHEVPVLELVGK